MKQPLRMTAIIEREDDGFVPRNRCEHAGTVTFEVPDGDQVTGDLAPRDWMDYRPGADIRIAPHFYSQDEERDLTIRKIRRLCESIFSEWTKHHARCPAHSARFEAIELRRWKVPVTFPKLQRHYADGRASVFMCAIFLWCFL